LDCVKIHRRLQLLLLLLGAEEALYGFISAEARIQFLEPCKLPQLALAGFFSVYLIYF
jgi:hypothetical protein